MTFGLVLHVRQNTIHERRKIDQLDFVKMENGFVKDTVKRMKRQAADQEEIFVKYMPVKVGIKNRE